MKTFFLKLTIVNDFVHLSFDVGLKQGVHQTTYKEKLSYLHINERLIVGWLFLVMCYFVFQKLKMLKMLDE